MKSAAIAVASGMIDILPARRRLHRVFGKARPEQRHLEQDRAILVGIHRARHFEALGRELTVRVTLAHAHFPPTTQRSKKKSVPVSGNGHSAAPPVPTKDDRRRSLSL
jgi:hypothetical protein